MRNGDETVVGAWHPQHNVCKCQISEKLGIPDEHVQPVDILLTGAAVGEYEFR